MLKIIKELKLMQDIIAAIDDLLGHMGRPTKNVVMRELLRPVRNALRKQGLVNSKSISPLFKNSTIKFVKS